LTHAEGRSVLSPPQFRVMIYFSTSIGSCR